MKPLSSPYAHFQDSIESAKQAIAPHITKENLFEKTRNYVTAKLNPFSSPPKQRQNENEIHLQIEQRESLRRHYRKSLGAAMQILVYREKDHSHKRRESTDLSLVAPRSSSSLVPLFNSTNSDSAENATTPTVHSSLNRRRHQFIANRQRMILHRKSPSNVNSNDRKKSTEELEREVQHFSAQIISASKNIEDLRATLRNVEKSSRFQIASRFAGYAGSLVQTCAPLFPGINIVMGLSFTLVTVAIQEINASRLPQTCPANQERERTRKRTFYTLAGTAFCTAFTLFVKPYIF